MSNTTAKERPILFNGDMVRAILDGRKTQTRRVVKIPQGWSPESPDGSSLVLGQITSTHPKKGKFGLFITRTDDGFIQHDIVPCPYGQPGDRLWVRETWKPSIVHHCAMDACDCDEVWVGYAADGEGKHFSDSDIPEEWLIPKAASGKGNVSPLFMPRWASRITLEITDVRVERLQDISEEDAKAEGLRWNGLFEEWGGVEKHPASSRDCPQWRWYEKPVTAFKNLWQSINGPESWDANPWIWVVEFRRLP